MTEEYHKSFDTSGPKLSTFINAFNDDPYEGPEKALKSCEEAETYIRHIGYKMLEMRAQRNKGQESYYEKAMREIKRIKM